MEALIHSTTTKSRYHEKNEDSCFIGDNFIIIADGMGGECSGDIASKIAVDTISPVMDNILNSDADINIKDLMFSSILQADNNISQYIDEHPESDGMGTTILLMVYRNDRIYLAWCGDSRCYVFNNGKLRSLTKDHSYVQELIDTNKISIDESFFHPDNNLITRFVGGGKTSCIPEYVDYQAEESDIFILCSDGLSGYCMESDIRKEILSNHKIQSLPSQLKELAIQHGSDDDITIVTFCVGKKSSIQKHSSIFDWIRRK